MPEIKHYTVTQTREVKVTANSLADAVLLADAAFTHGQNGSGENTIMIGKSPAGIWGNTLSKITEVDIYAVDQARKK